MKVTKTDPPDVAALESELRAAGSEDERAAAIARWFLDAAMSILKPPSCWTVAGAYLLQQGYAPEAVPGLYPDLPAESRTALVGEMGVPRASWPS